MSSVTVLRMGALAGLLMLSTVACSSTTRLSSANMCKAAGGTYSQGTCQPGGSPLSAQKNELFPEPFAPSSATIAPRSTVMSTP